MSKYFYRIFTIIDLHVGAMQPCSSGLGMTLEASDFRCVQRLVAYSIYIRSECQRNGLETLLLKFQTVKNEIICCVHPTKYLQHYQ